MTRTMTRLAALAALALGTSAAHAVLPIYPHAHSENPALYTFTAAATGDIVAYFAGTHAAYHETLGLLVNNVATGVTGLQNHTTAIGTALDFGHVVAGDSLVFFINVATTGATWFSNAARNVDGANHVWSTSYAGGDSGVPAGTFVAFEDLPRGRSDNNYGDEKFVFTNVGSASTAPEPAAWALMLGGLGLTGAAARRRGRNVVAA